MSFRFKNSERSLSPDNLQLEIVDENLTASSSTNLQPLHPSASSSMAAPIVEHKETYVNMMYNNNSTTGTSLSPGTIESPIEDDDDTEMMKSRTKKISTSRAPFRFSKFNLMKKGSFKLTASSSPPPTELTSSPTAEAQPPIDKTSTFERQKSTTSSTGSTSRLKKLFMLSRADPVKKQQQKDASLSNVKHALWQNASLVMTMWPAIGNVEQVIMELRLGHHQQAHVHRAMASIKDDGTIEMGIGMKTTETQTELIDDCSPALDEFQMISENVSSENNNERRLNINSIEMIKDLKCIDDDAASGHRILFPPPTDTPETKL